MAEGIQTPPASTTAGNAGRAGAFTPDRANPATASKAKAPSKSISFAVEISSSQNGNIVWPLDRSILRGSWKRANIARLQPDESFQTMPDLPGLIMAVNTLQKKIIKYDPLLAKDNDRVLKLAQKTIRETAGVKVQPDKGKKWENQSDDNLKTAVYFLWRFVANKTAVVVRGKLPTEEEIKAMPGVVRLGNFSEFASTVRETPNQFLNFAVLSEQDRNDDYDPSQPIPEPTIDEGELDDAIGVDRQNDFGEDDDA